MFEIYLQSDETHSLFHRNKSKLTGQKPPLKPKDVWAICIRIQIQGKPRDLTLFNLAIDRKLRSSDLVALRIPADIDNTDPIIARLPCFQDA